MPLAMLLPSPRDCFLQCFLTEMDVCGPHLGLLIMTWTDEWHRVYRVRAVLCGPRSGPTAPLSRSSEALVLFAAKEKEKKSLPFPRTPSVFCSWSRALPGHGWTKGATLCLLEERHCARRLQSWPVTVAAYPTAAEAGDGSPLAPYLLSTQTLPRDRLQFHWQLQIRPCADARLGGVWAGGSTAPHINGSDHSSEGTSCLDQSYSRLDRSCPGAGSQVSPQLTYTKLCRVWVEHGRGVQCKGHFGFIKKNTATSKPSSTDRVRVSSPPAQWQTRSSRPARGQRIPKPPPLCPHASPIRQQRHRQHLAGKAPCGRGWVSHRQPAGLASRSPRTSRVEARGEPPLPFCKPDRLLPRRPRASFPSRAHSGKAGISGWQCRCPQGLLEGLSWWDPGKALQPVMQAPLGAGLASSGSRPASRLASSSGPSWRGGRTKVLFGCTWC